MISIGTLTLNGRAIMAPLAGITNLPFRRIVKEAGAALVCSEMVSAAGLVFGTKNTLTLLDTDPFEKPLSVQLFGAKPDVMAQAAKTVEASGADILDINLGCSVKKVTKTGAGVALMHSPDVAAALLRAVRRAISIPLTIKIRTGWDSSGEEAERMLQIAMDEGVDAITIHPRTATQGFSGKAEWGIISRLKEKSRIPVIGNGDITSPFEALEMVRQTGCDAVMVGRAAIGNPLIFEGINAVLSGEPFQEPDIEIRFSVMGRYLEASCAYLGETTGCRMMRSRLAWFVKGLPGSCEFRKSLTAISTLAEARQLIAGFRERLG